MTQEPTKRPSVSVVVPTLNCARQLSQCLESLSLQTMRDFEVLVVDGGSTDGTLEVAKQFAEILHFPRSSKMGFTTPYQQNLGAARSRGRFIYLLDSDMLLPRDALHVFVQCIGQSSADALIIPEVSIGSGYLAHLIREERTCYMGDDALESPRFFKKDAWESLQGLDSTMGGEYDWDIHYRLKDAGFKIARSNLAVWHDEGALSLRKLLSKKASYGRTARRFLAKYRGSKSLEWQFSPVRRGMIDRVLRGELKISDFAGIISLKMLESMAFAYGYMKDLRET